MKFKSAFSAILVFALMAITAMAQVDFYGAAKTTVLMRPTVFTATTAWTNDAVDVHGYAGVGEAIFWFADARLTNTMTASLEGSNDKSTWWTLTNASVATLTLLSHPNMSSTNLTTTNSAFVPGTLTTATPATDGFAGQYLTPAPFTSNAVFCTAATGSNICCLGIILSAQPRYMRVTGTIGHTNGIVTAGAVLIGRKEYGRW